MKKIISHLCLTVNLFLMHTAISMETPNQNTHIVAIPGQNGLGGNNYYMENIFPQFKNKIHYAQTPTEKLKIDLGQKNCIGLAFETLLPLLDNPEVEKIILHGSSQGTATAQNIIGTYFHTKIKAVILEAVMASGNSAIAYNTNVDNALLYASASYGAKCVFPSYSPSGMQAIDNINKIPKDLPIIIMHNPNDKCLPYSDALALYQGLYDNGYKNAYFLPIIHRGSNHINLLSTQYHKAEIAALYAILKKHELLPDENSTIITDESINVEIYQPTPENLLEYKNLLYKENITSCGCGNKENNPSSCTVI